MDGFLATDRELALCQIVGHSYDLDVDGTWERMESIFRKVSGAGNVAAMTNLELVRYGEAVRAMEITDTAVFNPSPMDVWFRAGERVVRLHPGERWSFT